MRLHHRLILLPYARCGVLTPLRLLLLRWSVLGAMVIASGVSCGGDSTGPETPPHVSSIVVTPSSANLHVGDTVRLGVSLHDASGGTLTGRVVTWTSGNTNVATVTEEGLVTALGAGTASVTAKSEGASASATVVVAELPVSSVSVSPTLDTLAIGASVHLTATARDSTGGVVKSHPIF